MKFAVQDIKQVLKKKGYLFYDQKWKLNLVGVRLNSKVMNLFTDYLYVMYKDGLGTDIVKEYFITTKPGTYYLLNPANVNGTAMLVPGQYVDAWILRLHQGRYEALGQNRKVSVYRDNDMDAIFEVDPGTIEAGLFGINIHRSNEKSESTNVDKWSAGCQVFKNPLQFNEFMDLVRKDKTINGNLFTYALLVEDDFGNTTKQNDEPAKVQSNPPVNNTVATPIQQPTITPPTDTISATIKTKEIVNKREKQLKIPELKIQQDEPDAPKKESEFTGSLMPFIIFNTHTFNYKQIDNFVLYYEEELPVLKFTIYDYSNEFTTLFLPQNNDRVALYLKPHNDKFNPIYIEFTINKVSADEGYFSFDCLPNIEQLYTEDNKVYPDLSSYELFDTLATELKLGFNSNIDGMEDKMTRINPFESNINFMRKEIQHTYKTDETFFTWFVDYYYNLNFIDLNNQFGLYKQQDSILSLVNPEKQEGLASDEEVEMDGKLVLSNLSIFRGTSNYLVDFSIINSTGDIKIQNGYSRYAQFYDSELNSYETQQIIPKYETQNTKFVRGAPEDPNTVVKYKYLGYQQTQDNTKNVHDNYLYAKLQNYQNLQEIEKMMLRVKIDKANFHIYRYQSVPVAIYEFNELNTDKLGVKSNVDVEVEKPKAVLLPQYSGYFVVKNIIYRYDKDDSYIRQELVLMRREWNDVIAETVKI